MIIDFLIIAVILLFASFGYRKGFFATLISFVAFTLCVILTFFLYKKLYGMFIITDFGKNIELIISENVKKCLSDITNTALNQLPLMKIFFSSAESSKGDTLAFTATQKIVKLILSIMVIAASFIISNIIIAIFKSTTKKVTELPGIHVADSMLGMLCGIMLGIIWSAIIYIVSGYMFFVSDVPFLHNQYNSSYIVMLISDLLILNGGI